MPADHHASDPAQWVDLHGDALFRYAMLRVRDQTTAEDLVQETLLAALKARDAFEGRSSERTWLIGILRRKIIDSLRRIARDTPVAEDGAAAQRVDDTFDGRGHWRVRPGSWPNDPLDVYERAEFRAVFELCFGKLPGTLAAVFALRELEEMETESICEVLSVSPSNVWTRLHRARILLRQCLEANWFGKSQESDRP